MKKLFFTQNQLLPIFLNCIYHQTQYRNIIEFVKKNQNFKIVLYIIYILPGKEGNWQGLYKLFNYS